MKSNKVKQIIPVIHVVDLAQTFYNIDICISCGINAVFLIKHGNRASDNVDLLETIKQVKIDYPDLWVGANFLGLYNEPAVSLAINFGLDALWTDNACLIRKVDGFSEAQRTYDMLKSTDLMYFGGVEFKYQRQPSKDDLPWVYNHATKLINVITTTGSGTGQEIPIEKLKRIRETVGTFKPIAVASGIDASNIKEIAKYANYFLVASSITESELGTEIIITKKLKELVTLLDEYKYE